MASEAQIRANRAYEKRHPEATAYKRARNMAMRFVNPVGKLATAVATIDTESRKQDLEELQDRVTAALAALDAEEKQPVKQGKTKGSELNEKTAVNGLATSIGYGDVKKVKDLRGHTDKEVIRLAKQWNRKSLEDEYDSRYENKNTTTYVKPKYTKSEMVEKFFPKPVKVSYQLTENTDNKISSEVMRFSSPTYENGNVKYKLIKTSDIKLAGGQKFISYKTLKEVTGTTNKLKNQLIQRVPNSNRRLNYDSTTEQGIIVKRPPINNQ